MKIRLLSVGKPRDRLLVGLHNRYAERLTQLGVRYEASWVPEVESGGLGGAERARQREADLLLERLDSRGTFVVMDGRGKLLSSEMLSTEIERWATPCLTLALGGPAGLHEQVLARADAMWSLSPLTLPHELARALVAEQLYRAVTLRRGLPYHR